MAGAAVPAAADSVDEQSLEVTATAYNSLPGQTDGEPNVTAWGDRLEPGMKAIAVSRDLIALGLGHGTEVRIDGLPGHYVVRDKMAKRWRRKIDIYMGDDVRAARRWGRRPVIIRWSGD
ncbi:MAG: 3D domain-containing protein [Myxococcota bacterium]